MSTRLHRSSDLVNSVAFQLGFGEGGRLQLEAASFVHPIGASAFVTYDQLRKAVIDSLPKDTKVKCMVWRDGERNEMHLIATDADFELVCKFARETYKRFPMFIVLVDGSLIPPPTVPPPGGGPVIKV